MSHLSIEIKLIKVQYELNIVLNTMLPTMHIIFNEIK